MCLVIVQGLMDATIRNSGNDLDSHARPGGGLRYALF